MALQPLNINRKKKIEDYLPTTLGGPSPSMPNGPRITSAPQLRLNVTQKPAQPSTFNQASTGVLRALPSFAIKAVGSILDPLTKRVTATDTSEQQLRDKFRTQGALSPQESTRQRRIEEAKGVGYDIGTGAAAKILAGYKPAQAAALTLFGGKAVADSPQTIKAISQEKDLSKKVQMGTETVLGYAALAAGARSSYKQAKNAIQNRRPVEVAAPKPGVRTVVDPNTGKQVKVFAPKETVSTKGTQKVADAGAVAQNDYPRQAAGKFGKKPTTVNPQELSVRAKNSLLNDASSEKPGSVEFQMKQIQAGKRKPIDIRTLEDGSTFIDDGRHTAEAARRLGIKDYPTRDLTDFYSGKSKTINQNAPVPKTVKVTSKNAENELLFGGQKVDYTDKRNLSLGQRLSPDRILRENVTRPVINAVNEKIYESVAKGSKTGAFVQRTLQGVNREWGVPKDILEQRRTMRGSIEYGKLVRDQINQLGSNLDDAAKTRVWATLDPGQAKKLGLTTKLSSLTPDEVAYRNSLKALTDQYTNANKRFLKEGQAANPDYLKRAYSVFEEGSDMNKAYNATKQNLLSQFKGRKEISQSLLDEAITDPGYLVAKKAAETHAANAMANYGDYMVARGNVSQAPRPGFVKLPESKIYGQAAGKWVPRTVAEDFTGFQYTNGIVSAFNDLTNAYDKLAPRQAKKQLLTVFNPAVRAGNQFSNRVVFSNLGGINPVEFNRVYTSQIGNMIKNRDPLYREAVAQGLTGIDITQAEFAKHIAKYADDPNMVAKASDWVRKSYSAADDKARVTAYVINRRRGYTPQQAAELTQRSFQDYSTVGFFYDMAAKTPLIGNAFVRFAGDAMRIAGNAAIDHPIRSISTVLLWKAFTDVMSKVSNESPEDRQVREDRFGAPKIPFTDVPLSVQTPWGEVNVARFMPFYQLNEVQNPLTRFLPIQGNPFTPQGWNDPLLGQFAQLAVDQDFSGKSISDPKNTIDQFGDKKFRDELPVDQQRKNQARFLATQNLPLGREIDAIYSAATGQPDVYGKTRTLPQALARAGGIKVEQFGPEQADKQRATNEFFDERAQIDAELAGKSPEVQDAWKRLTGYYKLRDEVVNEFNPDTTRNVKAPVYNFPEDKYKDYTSHPELYDMMEKKKNADAAKGVPLQPEFDPRLSRGFRIQLINNKSLAPGEDVEADERMYSNPEWDKYQAIKKEYTEKAKLYYPERSGEFVDELVKHKQAEFPTKGPNKKAYDEAYALYAQGLGPKPAYTDAVNADKEAYNEAKRQWTNKERAARGLPEISSEVWNNVTFGFESDEEKVYKQLKYGKGYGSGSRSKKTSKLRTVKVGRPYIKKKNIPGAGRQVAIRKPRVVVKSTKA